jgi:hypothetical protein
MVKHQNTSRNTDNRHSAKSTLPKSKPVVFEPTAQPENRMKLFLFVAAIIVVAIVALFVHTNNNDHDRFREYTKQATATGLQYAKQKCLEQGLSKDICNTVYGPGIDNICTGRTCWIVHTSANDWHQFSADVTVQRTDSGQYKVTDYLPREP